MALPATSALPQNGSIVSRLPLDEPSGSRADSVGSNTLTDNNTVGSVAGQFDANAADFFKSNSEYLSIDDASQAGLDGLTDYSVVLWGNFRSLTSNMALYSKYGSTTAEKSYYAMLKSTGDFELAAGDGATVVSQSFSWNPSTSTNYLIGISFDGSAGEYRVYVDGGFQASLTGFPNSIANSSSPFSIGARKLSSFGSFMDGQIQDMTFWNVELSDSEMTDAYNAYLSSGGGSGIMTLSKYW